MITVALHPGLRQSARIRHESALLTLPGSFLLVDGTADVTVAESAADVAGPAVVVGVPREQDRPLAVDTPARWDPAIDEFAMALQPSSVFAVDAVAWADGTDDVPADLDESVHLLQQIVAKILRSDSLDLPEGSRTPWAMSRSATVGAARIALSAVRTRNSALRARLRISGDDLSGVLEVATGSSARPSRWWVDRGADGFRSVDAFTTATGRMWRALEPLLNGEETA